jgi:membrane-bound lytic murein transglycosylase D
LLPVKGSDAAAEPLPVGYVVPIQFERATRTEARKVTHTVARGDTLATIAGKYKVSIEELRQWNSIGRLMTGQKLTIMQQVAVSTWTRKPAPAKVRKAAAGGGPRKASAPAPAKKPTHRARS